MKRCIQVLAVLSGVLVSLSGAAQAMAAPQSLHVLAASGNQSDSNLRWARERVGQNIDMLQQDRHDYGGYRERAISLFQQAREQLTLALQFDIRHESFAPVANALPDAEMMHLRGECASDMNLNIVRRNIGHIIDVLQRDNGDYGGHRLAAIRKLEEGREMLKAAINWDDTH
jgi:hypothetical protein